MAAKTWEQDFRYPAIQASLPQIEPYVGDEPGSPYSYCLPLGSSPMRSWNPGKVTLIFLVLGFVGLIGGVVLLTMGEKIADGKFESAFAGLGVCSTLSGMSCFFLPLFFQKRIAAAFMGERGKELLRLADNSKVHGMELGQPDDRTISIDGDDHILVFFDQAGQRLVIEGISCRYQIRRADVVAVEPFEFMSNLGARISYRIDSETVLDIAIAKTSLKYEIIRQLPILFFLRGRIRNWILEETQKAIGSEVAQQI